MEIRDFGKTAIVFHDSPLSYRELAGKTRARAAGLPAEKGDRVVIFSENRPEWIEALFAIWLRNGVAIPVDMLSTAEELAYILGDAGPKAILASKATAKTAEKAISAARTDARLILLEDTTTGPEPHLSPPSHGKDDLAAILYTSGTTGRPKGVMLSFGNLASNISGIEQAGIASSSDVLLSFLPFHHSYPLMVTVLLPLHLGATIVMTDRIAGTELLRSMKTHGVTILVGVPRVFEAIHRSVMARILGSWPGRIAFGISRGAGPVPAGRVLFRGLRKNFGGRIRYFVSGGAKLDERIARDFLTLGLPVIEGYGLTETSPICTFNPPDRIRTGSAGRPIPGVKIRILDGEILVSGPNVMKGYLNRDEETRRAFSDGMLRTGDLGHIDPDGYLFVTGRKKDMIVLASGKNINPEEIEGEIVRMGGALVREAAVVERAGRLHALVHPDFEKMKAEGVLNIREKLKWDVIDPYNMGAPDYRRLAGFDVAGSEFPKTRLGKIRRFLIQAAPGVEGSGSKTTAETPEDPVFRIVKKYLAGVTRSPVEPGSHIELDLGLDSLDKVELIHFIEQSFGLVLDETSLSGLLVLRNLTEHIRREKIRMEERETGWADVLVSGVEPDISPAHGPLSVLKWVLLIPFAAYFRLSASGLEKLPPPPCIIAPNHQSYLDGFLLIATIPRALLRDCYFLATGFYFQTPFRKRIARLFHVVTLDVDRNLTDALKTAATLLKQGKYVVIFPEGARTRDGSLLPFKKAFAILSRELDVPVVPVSITGAYESFPVRRRFPAPGRIGVRFLAPVLPGELSYDGIARETRRRIQEALDAPEDAT